MLDNEEREARGGSHGDGSSQRIESEALEMALKSIPSCQRCKRARRKCDTLLPACNRCRKAQVECCFYDHVLEQVLPRSYVYSLLQTVRKLKQSKTLDMNNQIEDQSQQNIDHNSINVSALDLQAYPSEKTTFDNHFPVTTPHGPTFRYFGASSVFALGVVTLARARSDPRYKFSPIESAFETEVEPADFHGSCNCIITKEMVESSITLYMASVNVIFPFLDEKMVKDDLDPYWRLQEEGSDPALYKGNEAHQFFRIKMIAAIASASRSRHNASRIACDHGCYLQATRCIAEVTSEASTDSLRALMLLIVYCLFRPRKGDIWKLLDYACRLSVELGYHTEPEQNLPIEQREEQRNTFWSLYTIERIIGHLFGRPSDLPEAIITTDFYKPLALGDQDQVRTRHHHKLVYLRSIMFRDMYLTQAETTQEPIWYQAQLTTIMDWYHMTKKDEVPRGMTTIINTITFHETIMFLFQPRILKILRDTRNLQAEASSFPTVPIEIYHSAGRLIEELAEVHRSPQGSLLGTFPFTFITAHYVYQASMMIMAYCLLIIDSRISFVKYIADTIYIQETTHIDQSRILDLSSKCLILLCFCADKWPGMIGMRDTFRQISDQILPHILRMT